MLIREWKYEDILRISELEKECFPQEPWSFKLLASCFETEGFYSFVAEDGGEIAGYGNMTVVYDTADLGNIATAEAYRKSGVATAVLQKLCEVAKQKGALKMFLEVRVSNSEAMLLYLKHGFNGLYARPRYYSNGEDCLVMVKEL